MCDALDDSSHDGLSFREAILASPRSPHLDVADAASDVALSSTVMSPSAGSARLPPPPKTSCNAVPANASSSGANKGSALELYRTHRVALDAFLKEEGNIFAQGPLGNNVSARSADAANADADPKREPKREYVGLANQGATCYLNSLVQALFMLPPFRRKVLAFSHDPALHGSVAGSIPAQLQRLFARLRLSARPHVSTKPLTRAFGWGSAEGFQQHDVQELFVQVLDALERSNTAQFKALFEGSMSSYIRGEGFDRRSDGPEPFTTLMLPIRGHPTLEAAIRSYFTPDRLEGDNQYMHEGLGKKVDALKGAEVVDLPPVLVINLGRFLFDYATMRRVKINDVCSFPETLDMDAVLKGFRASPKKEQRDRNRVEVSENEDANLEGGVPAAAAAAAAAASVDPFGEYDLVATMVHSGTTHGGHYRAFIRGDRAENCDNWFNFNDSFVSRLGKDEVRTMFGRDPSVAVSGSPQRKGTGDTAEESDESNADDAAQREKERLAHVSRSCCNSYMLIYRKRDSGDQTAAATSAATLAATAAFENELIPAQLRAEILEDNVNVELMSRVYEARCKIARITVCLGSHDFETVELLKTATLREATDEAVRVLLKECADDREHRLRVFEPRASRPGRTFGSDQIDATLVDLGLANGSYTLLLESRRIGEEDPPFEEYDPLDFYVQLQGWDSASLSPCALEGQGGGAPILVAGKQGATVGQLVAAVAAATRTLASQFNLLLLADGTATVLDAASMREKSLKKDFKIWSGGNLVLEKKDADAAEGGGSGSASRVAAEYEDSQNRITVRFNVPGSKTYDIELACDKRDTLAELKTKMAPLIGFDGTENNAEGAPTVEHFRCRCNARAPVLKKLDETLGGIGLSRGSILHVEKGAQIREGQVVVKFYIYDPCPPKGKKAFVAALKMPVDKTATVAEIKQKLVTSRKFASHPPERLRLHVKKKGQSDVGPLLRDDTTMERAGGRGRRLTDETLFAVRFLEHAERVTKKHVVVKVRHWLPTLGELRRGEDVVLSKHATVGEVAERVWDFVSAAGRASGGALFMAKSHISSANHLDLKKKALAAAKGASGRMIQWVEMPVRGGAGERGGGGGGGPGGGGEALPASEVGAPVKVSGETLAMKTPLGMLRDGEVFFTHLGADLKQALGQWCAPKGEEKDGGVMAGSAGGVALRGRNPNWKPGGQEPAGPRRLPRRREVGIKIRTEFDVARAGVAASAVAEEADTSVGNSSDGQERPAGSAVEAVRLLPRSSA